MASKLFTRKKSSKFGTFLLSQIYSESRPTLPLYCPARNHTGIIPTGKIRPNFKFAAFWCVFLKKLKVDP